MPDSRWEWDQGRKRYVSVKTGRAVRWSTLDALRHDLALGQRAWADDMARQVANGNLTARRWEMEVRERVKLVYLTEYMLARGGKNVMTFADYGRVGRMLRDQYGYLRRFTDDVLDGKLSEAQLADRTGKYFESSTYAYERGRAAAYEGLTLPCYPGDGGTVCLMRCRCRWEIRETKTRWTCRYRTSTAESCPGCLERKARYSPYIQRKDAGLPQAV